jgi:hypothetical protein
MLRIDAKLPMLSSDPALPRLRMLAKLNNEPRLHALR